MSNPKQRSRHRAILQHATGEIRLLTSYEWRIGKGVDPKVQEILKKHPAKDTVNEMTNDWEPYVKKIAKLTGAEIVEMVPYPKYEPDTIF
jgi:hypothetical protein